jgi:GTP-binding protein HflX
MTAIITNFIIKKTITQLMKGINKISKSNKNIITENKNLNTLVIHPDIKLRKSNDNRDPQQCLDEAISLTRAISLNVLYSEIITINTPRPGTLMGSGRIADIKTKIHDLDIYIVILDGNVSPIQQRNLEREWNVKVLDRTALILEIFGDRAVTKEGVLQVELAQLNYQRTRLVRSWTHLERQRGATSFIGGPGESQLELDRRLIDDEIVKIKKRLNQVIKTRNLHRIERKKTPHPIVSLIGYTNAGKSSLFNQITMSDNLAKDMLFATLDTTMRKIQTSTNQTIILSDTVGFISNLPTELIEAFKSTLEEIMDADLIIHVRDISVVDTEDQRRDVINIMEALGKELTKSNYIEVHNKIDLVSKELVNAYKKTESTKILMSAKTGEGLGRLKLLINEMINANKDYFVLKIPSSRLDLISWIYKNSVVISKRYNKTTLEIKMQITKINRNKLLSKI